MSLTYNFLDSNFKGSVTCKKKRNVSLEPYLIHVSKLNQLLVSLLFTLLQITIDDSVFENAAGWYLTSDTILTGDCWIEIKCAFEELKHYSFILFNVCFLINHQA